MVLRITACTHSAGHYVFNANTFVKAALVVAIRLCDEQKWDAGGLLLGYTHGWLTLNKKLAKHNNLLELYVAFSQICDRLGHFDVAYRTLYLAWSKYTNKIDMKRNLGYRLHELGERCPGIDKRAAVDHGFPRPDVLPKEIADLVHPEIYQAWRNS